MYLVLLSNYQNTLNYYITLKVYFKKIVSFVSLDYTWGSQLEFVVMPMDTEHMEHIRNDCIEHKCGLVSPFVLVT